MSRIGVTYIYNIFSILLTFISNQKLKPFSEKKSDFPEIFENFLQRRMGSPLFSLIWTIQENADSTIQNFHISNFLNSSMELLRQRLYIKLIKVFKTLQRKHARTQSIFKKHLFEKGSISIFKGTISTELRLLLCQCRLFPAKLPDLKMVSHFSLHWKQHLVWGGLDGQKCKS